MRWHRHWAGGDAKIRFHATLEQLLGIVSSQSDEREHQQRTVCCLIIDILRAWARESYERVAASRHVRTDGIADQSHGAAILRGEVDGANCTIEGTTLTCYYLEEFSGRRSPQHCSCFGSSITCVDNQFSHGR
uniref:Uncharacterized protein n=1 Tax=Physcomitrium patens TaxID=3218 RepID=A0A2K1KM48_PHYPA|nr:hypothetical protein PHYPA_005751 [Physcomitrium patens]